MRLQGLLLLLLMPFTLVVQAKNIKTPHQQLEQATEVLLKVIEEKRGLFDKDPEAYYSGIANVVEPLIDFPSFTRSVMGVYGTKEYYQSLEDAAAKEQYRKNYDAFVVVFKRGLLQTYAKGMLAFNGQKITVTPPTKQEQELIKTQQAVDVLQNIQNGTDIYQITYKMRPDKKGDWLLRNVVIESVNVGLLYRNQFAAAMEKYQQDFAQVIEHWVDDAEQASQEVAAKVK